MQQAVRKYLLALEAGDAEKAAALFVRHGWVQSPFLGRLPVRDFVHKVTSASKASKLTVKADRLRSRTQAILCRRAVSAAQDLGLRR